MLAMLPKLATMFAVLPKLAVLELAAVVPDHPWNSMPKGSRAAMATMRTTVRHVVNTVGCSGRSCSTRKHCPHVRSMSPMMRCGLTRVTTRRVSLRWIPALRRIATRSWGVPLRRVATMCWGVPLLRVCPRRVPLWRVPLWRVPAVT